MPATFRFLVAAMAVAALAGCPKTEPTGPECPGGQALCNSACVDTQVDPGHCGACETACESGQVCSNGACATTCAAGLSDCDGSCRDLQTDLGNCGACGSACAAGQQCVAGACVLSCQQKLTECDGTCRDLQSDPDHCGACGTACASGESCQEGQCVASCQSGQTACDGSCRDLMTDRANCGACGNACAAGEVCSMGQCALSCQQGLSECGGVCRDLLTDRTNCGTCGNACPAGQICGGGACVVTCSPGLTDCAGTCVDVNSSNANCGACGSVCAAGQVCSNGACAATCAAGQTVCSGTCTQLSIDPQNCGACGHACGSTEACINDACRPLGYFSSCATLLAANPASTSGVYTVDPDEAGPATPGQVYCDMTTDGGGWTLIVLTNGGVAGHPNVAFAVATSTFQSVNGTFSGDLDGYDLWTGTTFWNGLAPQGEMLFKVGTGKTGIQDAVKANFSVYANGGRITWNAYTALQGGIPNIDYNNNGYLSAGATVAAGGLPYCTEEGSAGVGLYGPWFYGGCSNVSPWCIGHGDCNGSPVRMQWRNQANYTTATASNCSSHGEIFVR